MLTVLEGFLIMPSVYLCDLHNTVSLPRAADEVVGVCRASLCRLSEPLENFCCELLLFGLIYCCTRKDCFLGLFNVNTDA